MNFKCVLLMALLLTDVAHGQSSGVTVEVDTGQSAGTIRDLFGVNRKPSATAQTGGTNWDAASLYAAFGLTQVRTHDTGVDLCSTYTAASRLNTGVSPAQPVTGCTLSGTSGRPHFTWTPTSSADSDLNNPDNYDFSSVDEAIRSAVSTGASIYLRLGESYNGPNDTADPVAWAKVATNIYKHVIGVFKPSTGVAANPVFVEIHNEPDGAFWAGSTETFNTLFIETSQRVRAAAAAAGKNVKIGGAGFTRSILTTSNQTGNPANGFIAAVGTANLDFYSAHLYDSCSTATLASSANFLRSLRALVDRQGGTGKPIHITEWNIGLGQQCGEAFFSEQRTQSFASGVLNLMQDPAQSIEAAHFYAAMPLMSLFNFTSAPGKVRVNPSAWALWAHSRLNGMSMLVTEICTSSSPCLAGHAAESASLMALAGKSGDKQRIVVTNDTNTSVNYTLRVKGLSAGSPIATISIPPTGVNDLALSGNPAAPDAAAVSALIASIGTETRSGLTITDGKLDMSLSIPAHSLQLVEIAGTTTTTARADCLFNWAERTYPQFFAPAGATSATALPYYYRYYTGTRSYIATSSADANIWVLGPSWGTQAISVGALSTYLTEAGCE